MFRLVVIGMLVAVASAGLIGDYGHGGLLAGPAVVHAAPTLVAAPVALKTSLATSYANGNSISLNPVPVAVHAAPAVVHAAPVVVKSAPILLGGLGGYGGLGLGLGGHGGYGH